MEEAKMVRRALGITQQTLANYLSVNREQLSKAERHIQFLPTKTFVKLSSMSVLVATIDPAAETSEMKKITDETARKLDRKVKLYEVQALSARIRLEAMQERYRQCTMLLQVCNVLLDKLPAGAAGKNDRLHLEIMKADALKKMRTCNPVAQAVLQVQADAFTWQAQQLRAMIQ